MNEWLAHAGDMALSLMAYIRNLPDEIEQRLRESEGKEVTFRLQRYAYTFWSKLNEARVMESQKVKLYILPLGDLRFNVMTQTYDNANMPETPRIGAIVILNDIEAQLLAEPLLEPWESNEKDEGGITPGQAEGNEANWSKETGLAVSNKSGFESEIWSGRTFTPRSIACHGLPSNPYESSLIEPPNWEWKPQHFLDIMAKVKSLKAVAPPFSELQQRYNDITAKGRQVVFEKEIEWLWGSEISTLMKPHDLTEEDKVISSRILEHEENERMNIARAAAGKWVDPPELESPPEFWARQGSLAARGQAGEMKREQETRKVWLKVYEELIGLYNTTAGALPTTPASGLAGDDDEILTAQAPEWKPQRFVQGPLRTENKSLSKLETGIIEVYQELQTKGEAITDSIISAWLSKRGIVNKQGDAYSREYICKVRNRLRDLGYDLQV